MICCDLSIALFLFHTVLIYVDHELSFLKNENSHTRLRDIDSRRGNYCLRDLWQIEWDEKNGGIVSGSGGNERKRKTVFRLFIVHI